MPINDTYSSHRLACGAHFAALQLPGRHTVSFQIRVMAGLADEPADKLGIAGIVEQTLRKGTQNKSARELADAFDTIGVQTGGGVGRQSTVYRCTCLPEYLDEALALHAEMLGQPSFPDVFCKVGVELTLQELTALEDDPQELTSKLIAPHAFGAQLGRHELGERQTVSSITRDDLLAYWQQHYHRQKLQITVAGDVDVKQFASLADQHFAQLGVDGERSVADFDVAFNPGVRHREKDQEQEHIVICWPGVAPSDPAYTTEKLLLTILGGGMSSRLFTEVREKQGLVYWVGAWSEHPRGAGMMFVGASTTPARCDQTARTLLREVDRLAEDIAEDELQRAKVSVLAKMQTHGEITRGRLNELSGDLFHLGHPIEVEEKQRRINAVTVEDIRQYLAAHPRDRLCVQTLGPRALEEFQA